MSTKISVFQEWASANCKTERETLVGMAAWIVCEQLNQDQLIQALERDTAAESALRRLYDCCIEACYLGDVSLMHDAMDEAEEILNSRKSRP